MLERHILFSSGRKHKFGNVIINSLPKVFSAYMKPSSLLKISLEAPSSLHHNPSSFASENLSFAANTICSSASLILETIVDGNALEPSQYKSSLKGVAMPKRRGNLPYAAAETLLARNTGGGHCPCSKLYNLLDAAAFKCIML